MLTTWHRCAERHGSCTRREFWRLTQEATIRTISWCRTRRGPVPGAVSPLALCWSGPAPHLPLRQTICKRKAYLEIQLAPSHTIPTNVQMKQMKVCCWWSFNTPKSSVLAKLNTTVALLSPVALAWSLYNVAPLWSLLWMNLQYFFLSTTIHCCCGTFVCVCACTCVI